MTTTEQILQSAHQRAQERGLPYSGALTPKEAYELWRGVPGATLVDVRTHAEWDYVGRIPGAVEIEFQTYPGGRPNPAFVAQLEEHIDDKRAPVLFICRSGGRSHNAALLANQAGYANAYNVLEGFEGDRDDHGHRNTRGGWRVAGLPWVQS